MSECKDNSDCSSSMVNLISERSDIDDHWFLVLNLCDQRNPTHFGIEFPSCSFDKFEYLDSGTYSHVIKAIDREHNNLPIVFKVIKVMQRVTVERFCKLPFKGFELYSDVFQEIVITKLLSNLHNSVHDNSGYKYLAHTFPKIYRTRVVRGEIPDYFNVKKCKEATQKIKPVEQLIDLRVPNEHLVILMKYGGDSLWHRIQARHKVGISPDQLLSVCYQVMLALSVSEMVYQFEHRDLHMCNILVKSTKQEDIIFKVPSSTYRVKSFGIKACIIDATFSRVSVGNSIYFTDLSTRLKRIGEKRKPNGQEAVYQKMLRMVGDRWHEWFPQTNIFWLKHLFDEILASDAFVLKADHQQTKTLWKLINNVLDFKTVSEFICVLRETDYQVQCFTDAASVLTNSKHVQC